MKTVQSICNAFQQYILSAINEHESQGHTQSIKEGI
jgi:hypothetical protein